MPKARLTRIRGAEHMRTDVIEGEASHPPIVGRRFSIHGEPIDPQALFRTVVTSPVVAVLAEGYFVTESGSMYQVELLTPLAVLKRGKA